VPLTYISAFRAPQGGVRVEQGRRVSFDNQLVRRFPNITNVDMTATIAQVQRVLGQVIRAVEFLFAFTLAAGLVVLFAAVTATREERTREFAIGRKCAGDVRRISIEFATRIDQHQIACAYRRGIGAVMQHTGVGACGDNRGVGRKLCAMQSKFVQEFSFQMVFPHRLTLAQHARTQLHGAHMGTCADARGTPHGVLFVRVFDQTHFI
jgi:hypothetical protein